MMKRRYITSALLAFLMLFVLADSTLAQNLRPSETFYITPRVGLTDYTGDRDPAIGFMNEYGVDGRFPWLAGVEVGYQFTPAFALGLAYEAGNYPTIMPGSGDDYETLRHTGQLLLRYTFGANSWRLAPFIDAGAFAARGHTDPNGDKPLGYGPMLGLGLDVALNNRISLFVRAETNWSIPDSNLDGAEESPIEAPYWQPPGNPWPGGLTDAERRQYFRDNQFDFVSEAVEDFELPQQGEEEDFFGGFDALNSLQLGLKINFKSAFTAAQVLSLDCPIDPIEVGETATFTAVTNDAEATPPVNYTWDFGAAGQADGLVVTRQFQEAGTYNVTFTASNDGASDTETCMVTVEEPPVAAQIVSVNADPMTFDVCEPQTVEFSANVRGDEPVDYTWRFDDGETGDGPNPTHVYDTPGTYTVTLEVSNATGTDTRSITVTAEECIPEICYEVTEMNPVFFGRNSSTLTDEGRAALRENLELFEQCPNLCGRIVGYAAPGERNPQELSEDRARAAEEFYIDNGIATDRFETEGEGVPAGVTTTKKEGASQYRRVDTLPMQCVDM